MPHSSPPGARSRLYRASLRSLFRKTFTSPLQPNPKPPWFIHGRPAHLCLALTVEHFRANVGQVLRLVVVPEMVLILAASGVVYLIH